MLIGVVFLLFGLKLFRIIVFLSGFVGGFLSTLVVVVASDSTGTTVTQPTATHYLISLAVGVGCGFIALCCVKVTVFLIGFGAGFILTQYVFLNVIKMSDTVICKIMNNNDVQ